MSEKITFKELVELIAEQSRQSHASANSFIHELVSIIESGLKTSGSVSISGFGKFELRWMNERTGTHPQTGDEITIPAQNKVVFKPYKALREEVNRPYNFLKTRLIREDYDAVPAGFEENEEAESGKKNAGVSETSAFRKGEKDLPTVDELLIIHDNPHFSGGKSIPVIDTSVPLPKPIALPDEDKMAREVQKSGSFQWSYAAAVIIALIAFLLLFYMMQNRGETESAQAPQQTEQQLTSPPAPAVEGDEITDGTDPASVPDASGVTDDEGTELTVQTEFTTETYNVEPGQSLWTIAESRLGNPYLWPLLYHLNNDILDNPNQLPAASDLNIPKLSNPDNLNSFEREQVALGYLSLYEWYRVNNPDEARYFLWAVGVFSPDLLESPPLQVNPDDLVFARNR
jgi:nucleoid DNA-binding protein